MFDLVFVGAVFTAFRIAPVVLDDEFTVRSFSWNAKVVAAANREAIIAFGLVPAVLDNVAVSGVRHPPAFVRLAIEGAGDFGDSVTRDDLLDEHDATANLTVRFAADVKAQVYFLEIHMEGDKEIQHPRIEKHEANKADEAFALVQVELGADGNARGKEGGVHLVVRHDQIPPFR